MAGGQAGETMRHLNILFRAGALGRPPDRQLLEQFLTGGSEAAEAAFASGRAGTGRMVLGVSPPRLIRLS